MDALEHCKNKIIKDVPAITKSAEELCASREVDVVMIANSDAFHVPHTLLGLKHNKVVFVEKPLALSLKDIDSIIEAEKQSQGTVMVGYMRRYAAAFADAIKEIGSMDKVLYARVRDIIGPNSAFVGQSGTFPKTFSDYNPQDSKELKVRTDQLLEQALEKELAIPVTQETTAMWRNLGSLGSHDLSVMREVLGMPTSVLGASLCKATGAPFWRSVSFHLICLNSTNSIQCSISIPGFCGLVRVWY